MSFYRKRTDANHAKIGRALRAATPTFDVHGLGVAGCDFVARDVVTKRPVFIEVKDPDQPPSARMLTANELAMQAAFPGDYHVVLTVDEALAAVGVALPVARVTFAPVVGLDRTGPAGLSPLARRAKRRG